MFSLSFLDLDLLSSSEFAKPQVHKFMIVDEASAPSSPSYTLQSQYVLFDEVELLLRHSDVPQVPEYPEGQAEEDQQRSRQHEKVPETQRCKDPDEQEDEADDVKNHSQRQKDGALLLRHSRSG
ncbi:hypothetical protein PAMA_009916 [Pampus argenteus]